MFIIGTLKIFKFIKSPMVGMNQYYYVTYIIRIRNKYAINVVCIFA